jgi:hypothetical protein
MEVRIACIVEGQGELEAVPILVRRLGQRLAPELTVHIPRPIRIPKSKLLRQGELERAVELAARMGSPVDGILIILDSDDDCPAELGPALLARARQARADVPIGVVLAKREFEGWFLAAAQSLAGYRGLAVNLRAPADPEAVRGAKEWLSEHMDSLHPYVPTLDQPACAAHMDLDQALQAASFGKCWREVRRLLTGASGADTWDADQGSAGQDQPL